MRNKGDTVVNPIYHWSERDIWDYIHKEHIETNPLYECGYRRVGCIGCPLAGHKARIREFHDYPKFKNCYILAFDKMLQVRKEKGKILKKGFSTGKEVFDWWMEEHKYNVSGQISLFERR